MEQKYESKLAEAKKEYESLKRQLEKCTDKTSSPYQFLHGSISALEKAFPELKNTEDDRIKKWLICYFKEVCDNVSEKEKKGVLSWLEKQCKQKEDATRVKIVEYLKNLILDQSQRGFPMLNYEDRVEEEVDLIISIAKEELRASEGSVIKVYNSDVELLSEVIDDALQQVDLDDRLINYLSSLTNRISDVIE
jgi:hypothetical protein